jgi:hypothetical protein
MLSEKGGVPWATSKSVTVIIMLDFSIKVYPAEEE